MSDPENISRSTVEEAVSDAANLSRIVDHRTVDTLNEIDDDTFFSDDDGKQTVATRYDLEKEVETERKPYCKEVERYWVNKPYAFVSIIHSSRKNEHKYYLVEPYLTKLERDAMQLFTDKLRTTLRFAEVGQQDKQQRIEDELAELVFRYDYFNDDATYVDRVKNIFTGQEENIFSRRGSAVRPETEIDTTKEGSLDPFQLDKIRYYLIRNFLGYERIDGITHDIKVEDISCDGYNQNVFVYHTGYEQLISNIKHGKEELDDFVVKLAQRSGQGISKRNPQVDATLPNGSRAQLTLGEEVSDHGTNYTIRQFKEIPFTPIDLINWNTFSLDQMAFLWLAIENNRSLMFAGGTASGKTTSLNAVSLFIPSKSKIVSIEDTREVELPQRNWVASVTRPSFSGDDDSGVDEFDLLEAALRQRPEYIVFGEVRGEEGRTLFQVMSTGHTTYTTFHADSVSEVIKRFTTEPINVSKTLFTSLDLVSIQTQTRVNGEKVRRNKTITEVNDYQAENHEINVKDVFQWDAEHDEHQPIGGLFSSSSSEIRTLERIRFDRGWDQQRLHEELQKRRVVLAYLQANKLNTYTQVAATVQAFMNDQETVMNLIANNELEDHLGDLSEMENIFIDVTEEEEENAPRPEARPEQIEAAEAVIEENDNLLAEYRGPGSQTNSLKKTLLEIDEEDEDIMVDEPADWTEQNSVIEEVVTTNGD